MWQQRACPREAAASSWSVHGASQGVLVGSRGPYFWPILRSWLIGICACFGVALPWRGFARGLAWRSRRTLREQLFLRTHRLPHPRLRLHRRRPRRRLLSQRLRQRPLRLLLLHRRRPPHRCHHRPQHLHLPLRLRSSPTLRIPRRSLATVRSMASRHRRLRRPQKRNRPFRRFRSGSIRSTGFCRASWASSWKSAWPNG
jgi:hypothetical protein